MQAHAVVLVKAGAVPKTSSGKLQRGFARKMFLASQFERLYEWRDETGAAESGVTPAVDETLHVQPAPRSNEEIAEFICSQLALKVGVDALRVDAERPLTRYGVDSLMAIEEVQRLWRGQTITARDGAGKSAN